VRRFLSALALGCFVGRVEPGGFEGMSGQAPWVSANMLGEDQLAWLAHPPTAHTGGAERAAAASSGSGAVAALSHNVPKRANLLTFWVIFSHPSTIGIKAFRTVCKSPIDGGAVNGV
jgi:hypothetical protein